MSNEQLLQRILIELEEININTNSIETNVDLISQNTIDIKEQLTESGDSILLNNMQQQKNEIALIGIIGALFVIYYFVMRCLK